MKFRDCVILCDPLPNGSGDVLTLALDQFRANPRRYDRYPYSLGGVFADCRKYTGVVARCKVLAEFHALLMHGAATKEALHEAFLAIDEYRQVIAADIPGADLGRA